METLIILIDFVSDFGNFISESIFWAAKLLRSQAAPGVVSSLMLFALVYCVLRLRSKSNRNLNALETLIAEISETADQFEFRAKIKDIDQRINSLSASSGYRQLKTAWHEFRESLIADDNNESSYFLNTLRPSVYFNTDDLHYGLGFYRYIPGLFVTFGLFFTFLGLISALNAIHIDVNATSIEIREALNDLLDAASAKFIMSLTGLLSSILFTIFMRRISSKVDTKINELCSYLELRLSFVSLEEISKDQLKIATGQEENLRRIGLELVEKIGEPLRNEIPQAVSESIRSALEPVLESIGKSGTENVEGLANQLSSQLTTDISSALSQTSNQITSAGEYISNIIRRMDDSSGKMGQGMENAINSLTVAADFFTDKIGSAAEVSSDKFKEGADKFLSVLNETLDNYRTSMNENTITLRNTTNIMRETAERLQESIENVSDASNSLTQASKDLVLATEPIQQTVEKIEEATSNLSESVRYTSDTVMANAREIVTRSVNNLETLQESLKSEQGSIQSVLSALNMVVERLKGQGDQMDEIDEKLGSALENLTKHVHAEIETLESCVKEITAKIAPAIDTLNQVVDKAERFIPETE